MVVPSVSAKVAWQEERPGSRRKETRRQRQEGEQERIRRKQEGEQERIRRKDDRPFMFFRVPPSSSPTPPPAGQVTWLQ